MSSSSVPFPIVSFDKGLTRNKKPFLLENNAWSILENAYVYRDSLKKRQGNRLLGRFRRVLTGQALGNTGAGTSVTLNDIFTTLSLRATEPNAELQSGTLVVGVAAPNTATFTDQGDGTFAVTGAGVSAGSYVDYVTGKVVLKFTSLGMASAVTANFNYYPTLPGMGIAQREVAAINEEQTIWFDTKYAYVRSGGQFNEFITATTWAGTDSDFFWCYNYRGANPQDRLFFATNFISNSSNPMRYTNTGGSTWTPFSPAVTASTNLYSARILIGYYSRLLALNVWEGSTAGTAVNIPNRCRASQVGDPLQGDAWRTDVFGKGIVIDAPTNEAITGATFIKNTLVVDFERTTWQLRYVGEYGIPFIWERVSADFGSESTFSGVLFDNYRLSVGDKAITAGNSVEVKRIDLDIPDQVFNFKNANEGPQRIQGIRDYQRELVFWNYADSETQAAPAVSLTFPNKVLVYNYRNKTFSIFRDNVTAFGTYQDTANITWDNTDIFWDDADVFWDDFDSQSDFPEIVISNAQGYAHAYGYITQEESSLSVQGVDLTSSPLVLTVPNHNLQTGEIIYLKGLLFLSASFDPISTDLNNQIYRVESLTEDTISLFQWDFDAQTYYGVETFTPAVGSIYIGGGEIALFPALKVRTKDINLFQSQGMGTKLSSIDFLVQPTNNSAMAVGLALNASEVDEVDFVVGNKTVSTSLTSNFYIPSSDYAWFKFYASLSAQYFSITMYYNDDLMNTLNTHQNAWVLYAITAFVRMGGRLVL